MSRLRAQHVCTSAVRAEATRALLTAKILRAISSRATNCLVVLWLLPRGLLSNRARMWRALLTASLLRAIALRVKRGIRLKRQRSLYAPLVCNTGRRARAFIFVGAAMLDRCEMGIPGLRLRIALGYWYGRPESKEQIRAIQSFSRARCKGKCDGDPTSGTPSPGGPSEAAAAGPAHPDVFIDREAARAATGPAAHSPPAFSSRT